MRLVTSLRYDVYIEEDSPFYIKQLPVQRDWMDDTAEKHAYQCFPMSMANKLGWGLFLKNSLSFIWNGEFNTSPDNITILDGLNDNVHTLRAHATVSFNTGIHFSPDVNVSLLTMPTPNVFIDGVQCISTLISTSVIIGPLPIALMVTAKDKEIVIPSDTAVASILPINLTEINNMEILLKQGTPSISEERSRQNRLRGAAAQEMNMRGEWSGFYRNAVDADGNPMGEHESKKITMKVIENE
jgi:hypothetical protein